MATNRELDELRADRDLNHNRKMAALHHIGELVQAARRAGERAFRPEDWRAVMTAERFFHDPEGGGVIALQSLIEIARLPALRSTHASVARQAEG